mgnify:CR=1 FL=1
MSFNKGYELKKFEAHWEKLRIEYAAAGMTEDASRRCTTMTASSSIPNVPALSERRNFQIHRLNAVRMKHHL